MKSEQYPKNAPVIDKYRTRVNQHFVRVKFPICYIANQAYAL